MRSYKEEFKKRAQYVIAIVGLGEDVGRFTIDGMYGLFQLHPSYDFAIVPRIGKAHPAFEEVLFYANCLAFEHDVPTIVVPGVRSEALVRPIGTDFGETYIKDSFYKELAIAYESLNAIRLGPAVHVHFRWFWAAGMPPDLGYSRSYARVAREVSLYSTALRQLDPLSEFLCYYRIMESISGSNGKTWIADNISRLKSHDFGFLEFDFDFEHKTRRRNVFSVSRRRALARVRNLSARIGESNLADYLYSENRCGIAHGNRRVKVFDFGYTAGDVARDLHIIKLLSRIAIDDKREAAA